MSAGFREKWIEGKYRVDCGIRLSASPRSKVHNLSSHLKASDRRPDEPQSRTDDDAEPC